MTLRRSSSTFCLTPRAFFSVTDNGSDACAHERLLLHTEPAEGLASLAVEELPSLSLGDAQEVPACISRTVFACDSTPPVFPIQ
jgi:hypothetical protein